MGVYYEAIENYSIAIEISERFSSDRLDGLFGKLKKVQKEVSKTKNSDLVDFYTTYEPWETENYEVKEIIQKKKPNLHVLAIGVEYEDLKSSVDDALEFVRLIKKQEKKGMYDRVITNLLVAEKTKRYDILEAFEKLHNDQIADNDLVMLYYSGHGFNNDNKVYLMPKDYENGDLRSDNKLAGYFRILFRENKM